MSIPVAPPSAESPAERVSTPVDGVDVLGADARDRAFAQMLFAYKQVLSPTSLIPKPHAVALAIAHGREELGREGPFLQKILEPLPPI